jgi:phospholipid transport system substrate-binding protein
MTDALFPSRRAFFAGALALGMVALVPLPLRATPVARAESLVAGLSREILALINSGRPEAEILAGFERILAQHADMPAVSARILGPAWRTASPDQQRAFTAAFQTYLARRYGRQFRDFQQASIAIDRVRDAGDAGILVETRVARPGRSDIAVAWQVSERGGSPRIVNLIIEGVSMLANERAEIDAMLQAQRGSIDGLIATLRARS